jgi:hypothetical protein
MRMPWPLAVWSLAEPQKPKPQMVMIDEKVAILTRLDASLT